jgi:hypothetical protein
MTNQPSATTASTATSLPSPIRLDEFDEGGWLCPTLKNGSDQLDAIRKILKKQIKNQLEGTDE